MFTGYKKNLIAKLRPIHLSSKLQSKHFYINKQQRLVPAEKLPKLTTLSKGTRSCVACLAVFGKINESKIPEIERRAMRNTRNLAFVFSNFCEKWPMKGISSLCIVFCFFFANIFQRFVPTSHYEVTLIYSIKTSRISVCKTWKHFLFVLD